MSFRPHLAGPSKAAAGVLKTPLVRPRRYLTIPHPDLVLPGGKKGANRFKIALPLGAKRDVPHAIAYLRAVEAALGTSIISLDVAHYQDDLTPGRYISFSTLYPVDFKEPISVKMKKPKLSPYDMYGGPSLESVFEAFRNNAEPAKDEQDSISFKIELDTTRGNQRSRPVGIKGSSRNSRFARSQQDKLLDVLEKLGGDWDEVVRKWGHLRQNRPDSEHDRLDELLTSEDGSVADGIDERLDGELLHAQRREAKHRRHAQQETAGSEPLGEGEDVLAQRRKHADEVRQARHRQRLAQEAERKARSEEAEANAWKFEIGSSEPSAWIEQSDALGTDPSVVRFHLPKAPRASGNTSAPNSHRDLTSAGQAARISDEEARQLVEKKIQEKLRGQRPASSRQPEQTKEPKQPKQLRQPQPIEQEPIEQEPTAEQAETVQEDIPMIEAPPTPLANSATTAEKARPEKPRKEGRAAEKKVKKNKGESEAATHVEAPSSVTDSAPVKAVKDAAVKGAAVMDEAVKTVKGVKDEAVKAVTAEKEPEVHSQPQENKETQQSTKDDEEKKKSFWGRLLG